MKLLLDTHIFLWFISGDVALKSSYKSLITDPQNDVYLSIVSIWEASIKQSIGKLTLPQQAPSNISFNRKKHRIALLNLNEISFHFLFTISHHHRDPFDRMLICQSLENNFTIITDDPQIKKCPVKTI